MKTLSIASSAALSATITRPIALIEIGFAPTSRLSTAGDVVWAGQAWSGAQRVAVSGLSADGSGSQSARLVIGNADLAFGALVLGQGVADRPVRIWTGDAAALADDDLTLAFEGVIASAEVTPESVTMSLSAQGSRTLFAPRRFVGASAGFTRLIPAGTQIKIGSTTYTLERA